MTVNMSQDDGVLIRQIAGCLGEMPGVSISKTALPDIDVCVHTDRMDVDLTLTLAHGTINAFGEGYLSLDIDAGGGLDELIADIESSDICYVVECIDDNVIVAFSILRYAVVKSWCDRTFMEISSHDDLETASRVLYRAIADLYSKGHDEIVERVIAK